MCSFFLTPTHKHLQNSNHAPLLCTQAWYRLVLDRLLATAVFVKIYQLVGMHMPIASAATVSFLSHSVGTVLDYQSRWMFAAMNRKKLCKSE
jgi:hypothetical protein